MAWGVSEGKNRKTHRDYIYKKNVLLVLSDRPRPQASERYINIYPPIPEDPAALTAICVLYCGERKDKDQITL